MELSASNLTFRRFPALALVLCYGFSNPTFAEAQTAINIGHFLTGTAAFDAALSGHYAYIAKYADGLLIYDIADPSNPIALGHANNGGYATGVALAGNYAFLVSQEDGLRTYDISDPNNPINLGHTNTGDAAFGVAVAGHYAYVANNGDGLRIYDVSDPSNPVNVGHAYDAGHASGVAVTGTYAYIANDSDGLRIYDISDPTNPTNVARISSGGFAHGICTSGNYLIPVRDHPGSRAHDGHAKEIPPPDQGHPGFFWSSVRRRPVRGPLLKGIAARYRAALRLVPSQYFHFAEFCCALARARKRQVTRTSESHQACGARPDFCGYLIINFSWRGCLPASQGDLRVRRGSLLF